MAVELVRRNPPRIEELPDVLQFDPAQDSTRPGARSPQMVLITGHRRENFGTGFESICRAVSQLAAELPDTHFVYPVHLNPNVRRPVQEILGRHVADAASKNVHLIEPLPYLSFVAMMCRSAIILTDSGGVQEEAPSLGKPVLVMRDVTERPEAVAAGTVRLVGTNVRAIKDGVTAILTRPAVYEEMSRAHNPYGDGHASARIMAVIKDFFAARTSGA
jgi:UDP-N-acetylglucosamine 2-epimerase (non-hydrolysing)